MVSQIGGYNNISFAKNATKYLQNEPLQETSLKDELKSSVKGSLIFSPVLLIPTIRKTVKYAGKDFGFSFYDALKLGTGTANDAKLIEKFAGKATEDITQELKKHTTRKLFAKKITQKTAQEIANSELAKQIGKATQNIAKGKVQEGLATAIEGIKEIDVASAGIRCATKDGLGKRVVSNLGKLPFIGSFSKFIGNLFKNSTTMEEVAQKAAQGTKAATEAAKLTAKESSKKGILKTVFEKMGSAGSGVLFFVAIDMAMQMGEITKAFETNGAKAGIKQIGKSLVNATGTTVAYTTGSAIGSSIGAAVGGPVGWLVGFVGGMVIGGAFSSIASRVLKKIVGKNQSEINKEAQEEQIAQEVSSDKESMQQLQTLVAQKIAQEEQTGKVTDATKQMAAELEQSLKETGNNISFECTEENANQTANESQTITAQNAVQNEQTAKQNAIITAVNKETGANIPPVASNPIKPRLGELTVGSKGLDTGSYYVSDLPTLPNGKINPAVFKAPQYA